MDKPCQAHLQAAYHIIQYVKSTHAQGLLFPTNNNFQLKTFTVLIWLFVLKLEGLPLGLCKPFDVFIFSSFVSILIPVELEF